MKIWGDNIEQGAIDQMQEGLDLPIAEDGALMPDAHQGYGLPIGGVLATKGAVIPYAVGVDIACRMRLTVLPVLYEKVATTLKLKEALISETRFGAGAHFTGWFRRDHDIMDEDWFDLDKDRAWEQLGTSGGGNHFVEFGVTDEGLLALLSHSGSRGTGHRVCTKYYRIAKERHPEYGHFAWLDLDNDEGYWEQMQLMGRYAAANHECIHQTIIKAIGLDWMDQVVVENHHNFAWEEDGLIVHRKGATPAQEGVLGIIPGTMDSKAYIVSGRGNKDALNSASHGAGRAMSRRQAKKKLEWYPMDIELIGSGLDEHPGAYKNIDEVMSHQTDLVYVLGTFTPKIVRMA